MTDDGTKEFSVEGKIGALLVGVEANAGLTIEKPAKKDEEKNK